MIKLIIFNYSITSLSVMVVLVKNPEQLVNICLSYPTFVPWRSYPDNTVNETLGWLFEHDNEQYVVIICWKLLK